MPGLACSLLALFFQIACSRENFNSLPPGFKPVRGTERHANGWPMEIRGLKDDSIMVLVPGGEFSSGLDEPQLRQLATLELRRTVGKSGSREQSIEDIKRRTVWAIRVMRADEAEPTDEELTRLTPDELLATFVFFDVRARGVVIPQAHVKAWREKGSSLQDLLRIPAVRKAHSEEELNMLQTFWEDVEDPVSQEAADRAYLFSPQSKVHVGPFYIDKFEVTNRQYRKFVKAIQNEKHLPGVVNPGYDNDNLAPTGPKRTYHLWDDAKRNHDDQPVTCVSSEDALAYARWAGKAIPSRLQWGRAAVGSGDRIFPWGNDFEVGYCKSNVGTGGNTEERVQIPAKVGAFPKDRSPFGCFDMGGNVSEWVLDETGHTSEPGKHIDNRYRFCGGNAHTVSAELLCPFAKSTLAEPQVLGFRTVLILESNGSGLKTDN